MPFWQPTQQREDPDDLQCSAVENIVNNIISSNKIEAINRRENSILKMQVKA